MRIFSLSAFQYKQNGQNVLCPKTTSCKLSKVSFSSVIKPSSKFVERLMAEVFESGNFEKASGFFNANPTKFIEAVYIIKGKIQAQAQFLKEENIVIIRRLELAQK